MGRRPEPPTHLHLLTACSFFFLLISPSCRSVHGTDEKVLQDGKGKAPKEGPGSPPPKRGRRRPRKYAATMVVDPRGRGHTSSRAGVASGSYGGASPRSVSCRGRGSSCDWGRHAVVARPPRSRSHSADAFLEFIMWSERPAGTWLPLPCFSTGELPVAGLDGLWLQADGCCSRASWAGE